MIANQVTDLITTIQKQWKGEEEVIDICRKNAEAGRAGYTTWR